MEKSSFYDYFLNLWDNKELGDNKERGSVVRNPFGEINYGFSNINDDNFSLNSSGNTQENSLDEEKIKNDTRWNMGILGATGYSPVTSTPKTSFFYDNIIPNGKPPGNDEENYCPATIHLLISNLDDNIYTCKFCNKATSSYYTGLSPHPVVTSKLTSTLSEAFAPPNVFEENATISQFFLFDNIEPEKKVKICKFCKKNGEIPSVYQSHVLKDLEGKITCPILRKYRCELCGATGERAHTRKYCPKYVALEEKLPKFRRLANGVISSMHNHK